MEKYIKLKLVKNEHMLNFNITCQPRNFTRRGVIEAVQLRTKMTTIKMQNCVSQFWPNYH